VKRLPDRSLLRHAGIVAAAAAGYALLGQAWLRVAYPPSGDLRWTSLHTAIQYALTTVFLASVISAALAAERQRPAASERASLWALASIATAVIGLVAGLVLYSIAERVWWPSFSGGCHIYTHPTDGWSDGVCALPYPLEHAATHPVGWPLFWLGVVASALFAGAVGISVRRRLASRAGV